MGTPAAKTRRLPPAVYALLDPRDDAVRYIGATMNLKGRLEQHLVQNNWWLHDLEYCLWRAELWEQGLVPLVDVLFWCENGENVFKREKEWIEKGLRLGWRLLNKSPSSWRLMKHQLKREFREKFELYQWQVNTGFTDAPNPIKEYAKK